MERKLKVERREVNGKGGARQLRMKGRVPAVVYGHGADPLAVSVDARDLFHVLHTDAGVNVLIDMRVDGDNFLAMPRELQRDHIRGQFIHVDFLRIARDEKISVEVPIQLVGESHGVKEGGVLEHHLWTLAVECLPQEVPPSIDADITGLGIGDSLKVADLKIRGGLTVLTSEDEVVVSVVPPQILRVEEEEVAEEAAAEEVAEGAAAEAPAEGEGSPARDQQAGEAAGQ
jgi:large subunit ribosomal protein L25